MPTRSPSPTPAEEGAARFRRVARFVEERLAEDLSVEELSRVAAFSKFHFHRQFAALFGVGVYRYVQLVRLKRASYLLAFREDRSVLEIALETGYESPEAFCRAFKSRVGQTPTEFRRSPDWAGWRAAYDLVRRARASAVSYAMHESRVQILDFPETRVAVLEHDGDPSRMGESIRRFIAWRKQAGLSPRHSATYNLLYGDPDDGPPESFRCDLCAATDDEIAPNEAGVASGVIPAGRCAVLRHVGADEGFGATLAYLYGEWLPASGERPRDFPLFCRRVRFFPDVPENEAVTDFYLPLE
ncbi:MAG: helix-turn-helix domain-containing protein [Acidobacteria bacterium]|nr:helix-turn-helix domain-containing protein [Acidobacteriota bacterium]